MLFVIYNIARFCIHSESLNSISEYGGFNERKLEFKKIDQSGLPHILSWARKDIS